jgi:hypothetical protein
MDGVGRAAGIAALPFAVSELLKAVHPSLNVGEAASALGDVMFSLTQAANATKGIYGVGAVLSAAELVQDIQAAIKQGSVTPGELVGMLGNALNAVGGAMAVFPPTAPLGAALVAGGAAIGLGTLVVENWDGIKAGAAVAANAVTEKTQVVAQKTQAAVRTVAQAAPVVANEVRRALASGTQKLTRTLASGAQAVTRVIPRPVRQKLASTAQAVGTTVKRNLGNFQTGVTQALGWLGLTPRAAR